MSTAIVATPTNGQKAAAAAMKNVKVSLNDDTRRFSVIDDANKYAQLVNNVRAVYSLPENATLLFKYKDEEGDLISVSSDTELAEAFRVAGASPLRLTVTVSAAPAAQAAPMLRLAPAIPAVATMKKAAAKAAAKPGQPAVISPNVAHVVAQPAVAPSTPEPKKEKIATAPATTTAPVPAPAAAEAKKKPDVDPRVAKLMERNEALKDRCAHFKQRMQALKAAREAGVLQVASLQRDLMFARAEKHPRMKAVLSRGRFVSDVSIPDGTTLSPGEVFTKTWRFRNESEDAWPSGTRLLFVGKNSDRMGAPDEVLVLREVLPGAEIDISVPLTAPMAPGRYVTYFRLAHGEQKFGQRVWCSVIVKEPSSSSDEENNATAPLDADLVKYQHQLQVLAEMNLTNLRLNVRLLNKFEGNLETVVERLMARKARRAARLAVNPHCVGKCERRAAFMEAKCEHRAAKLEMRAERIAAKMEKRAEKAKEKESSN